MFCIRFLFFLAPLLPFSSATFHPSPALLNLKCVGCIGKNVLGPRQTTDPPNCRKYNKDKPLPEFTLACNISIYPDPICYAYKDGSFSGCDDRTRSPHPGDCLKVDTPEGVRKEVCFCHHNMCNEGRSWMGCGGGAKIMLGVMAGLAKFFQKLLM